MQDPVQLLLARLLYGNTGITLHIIGIGPVVLDSALSGVRHGSFSKY